MEKIRTLTLHELKQEIAENLEYAHPERDKNPLYNGAFGIEYGFLPVVNNIFFDTPDQAVDYILQNDPQYKDVHSLLGHQTLIEYYDGEHDSLYYTLDDTEDKQQIMYQFYSLNYNGLIQYEFIFQKKVMSITSTSSQVTLHCCKDDNNRCHWEGTLGLDEMLSTDGLIFPETIKVLIEYVYRAWEENTIDFQQTQTELICLLNWINAMTHTRPNTKFWRNVF